MSSNAIRLLGIGFAVAAVVFALVAMAGWFGDVPLYAALVSAALMVVCIAIARARKVRKTADGDGPAL